MMMTSRTMLETQIRQTLSLFKTMEGNEADALPGRTQKFRSESTVRKAILLTHAGENVLLLILHGRAVATVPVSPGMCDLSFE